MIKRYNPTYLDGLTKEQVRKRRSEDLVHEDSRVKTKGIKEIIETNLFTLFNLINLVLGILIAAVGRYENLLFLGAVIANFFISLFQEIKAKKILDNLTLLNAEKTTVVRDGVYKQIDVDKIVLDDIIKLDLGNQVVVDSIVVKGKCLVNEAFISGEETPQKKKEGDLILSGSFINSGSVFVKVEHIKDDNHISKINNEAKYVKEQSSIIMGSINKFIKLISYFILPIGIIMFAKQYSLTLDFASSVVQTAGAIIGMIPEGLVLLTSTILAISVIRLSKYNVLVQDLFSIESLARVDTICLDKTGTLTSGKMDIIDEYIIDDTINPYLILQEIAGIKDDNTPTMMAIRKKYKTSNKWKVIKRESFSSETKYSKTHFNNGIYILGSPEFITDSKKVDEILEKYPLARVLLLAKKENNKTHEIMYLVIQDNIRKSAKSTIKYLNDQDVNVKIISGDNPVTVSNIAKRVNVIDADKFIDVSDLSDDELKNIIDKYTIFGRVRPHQKKIIVNELQNKGRKVAFVGDGVNDVLALKESDCSIAVSEGSDAARNVSQLILMDSDFKSIPKIIYEGRRVVNNLKRSSSLYLMKTMYTILLVALFLFITSPYPIMPIHLSINNLVTIGIPSFVLALESNNNRVEGDFFSTVIRAIIPFSLTVFFGIVLLIVIKPVLHLSNEQISTISMLLGTSSGFGLLYYISRPFNKTRKILFYSMFVIFFGQLYVFKDLIKLSRIDSFLSILIFIFIVLSVMMMILIEFIFNLFKIKTKRL